MNEHTPQLSMWPPLVALSITLIMAGILSSLIVSLVGVVLLLVSIWNWSQENRITEPVESTTVDLPGEEIGHE